MKKVSLVLLLVFLSFCVFAEDEVVEWHHMKWNISGTTDSAGRQFCVDELVSVKVMNHNTGKPLSDAQVRVYYGIEKIDSIMTGPSGIVVFTPNQTGKYWLFMRHSGYREAKATFNVTECPGIKPAATASSTVSAQATSTTAAAEGLATTSATEASTSTAEATTTTQEAASPTTEAVTATAESTSTSGLAATTSTAAEETCSDRVQNQGETGVDCGGPCKICPRQGAGLEIVALIFAAVVLVGILLFFLLKGGRIEKAEAEKTIEKKHKHHHKTREENKAEKDAEGSG